MCRHCGFVVLAILLLALCATSLQAEPSKLDPLVRRSVAQVRSGASPLVLQETQASVNATGELDVFIVGDVSRAALEAMGVRVRSEVAGIFTAFVPVDALENVEALPGVHRIHAASRVEPVLNVSVPGVNASTWRGVGPNFDGHNGEGVIVGSVDSGVDYGHGDFKTQFARTRFLNIWDQTDAVGPNPSGFAYGSEWNAAELDNNSAREVDTDGHGTHVLAIAGGDGSQTGGGIPQYSYVGMAPRADLMTVKTIATSSSVVDGVAYIFDRAMALGKPAVVNISLGNQFGPKDGTSPFEAGLTALTGPGHIIVCAAGNDRGAAIHAEAVVSGSSTITMEINAASPSVAGSVVAIDGYYDSPGDLSVRITTPNGTMIGPIALGNSNAAHPGELTGNGWVYVENGVFITAGGAREIYVELAATSGSDWRGTWTFTYELISGSDVEVDMWRGFSSAGVGEFVQGIQAFKELLVEPANAHGVITTGAYVTKTNWYDCNGSYTYYTLPMTIGSLAPFSSPGPTRDGRQKPDITAPGIGVGSATTFDIAQNCPFCSPFFCDVSRLLNDNRQHQIGDGTSMAAPHVAGAVALLLQHESALTPDQVKQHLFSRAIPVAPRPNPDWGYGKLWVSPVPGWYDITTDATANPGPGHQGVAFADVDGDGAMDLYFANNGANRLLRNYGAGVFGDASTPPVDHTANTRSAVFGDVDNDGDLDLYLANVGANNLLRNEGNWTFADATAAPLGDTGPSTSALFGDVDNDGDLDIYLANQGANKLFQNEGSGTFVDATNGPLGDAAICLSAVFGDIDEDRDLDLYLGNVGANKLLRNEGGGVFVDATHGLLGDAGQARGVAFADVDNDGDLDLYLANVNAANKLFRNEGGGMFVDATTSPLGDSGQGTGFAFADVDNDGDLDLYLALNGANKLFRNEGAGAFVEATSGALGDAGNGQGTAFADVDGDGDLDLALANLSGGNVLMLNDKTAAANHWLHLNLIGTQSNRSGIGARVRIITEGGVQIREISGGSGLWSQNSLTAEFGLGDATSVDSVVVHWPSGIVQFASDVAVDQLITITENSGSVAVDDRAGTSLQFALHQSVPNPFSGSTSIRFDLPHESQITLQVYDVRGRRVHAVESGRVFPAGHHLVQWNGTDEQSHAVAPGVYFYVLETEGFRSVRRLVRLK